MTGFSTSEPFWQLLLRQSVQVSVVAVLVWAIVKLFAKDRPHLAHALWAIVLLKCLTPPMIVSPTGPFCWLDSLVASNRSIQRGDVIAPPKSVPTKVAVPTKVDTMAYRVTKRFGPTSVENRHVDLDAETKTTETNSVRRSSISIRDYVIRFWLLGSLLGIAWTSIRLICFLQRARQHITATPAIVETTLQRLRQRFNIRRNVRIRIIDTPIGPAVVGLFRPTILLPQSVIAGNSDSELEPLLAHELMHVRRGDLWWSLLQTMATSVWWFHPLVWLAARMMNREAERSCDEETIANLNCPPAMYARSLLDVLERKHLLRVAPALPGVRPVDITAKRMERIMRLGQGSQKRRPRWVVAVMLVGTAVTLPGAAWVVGQETESKTKSDPTSVQDFLAKPEAFANSPPATRAWRKQRLASNPNRVPTDTISLAKAYSVEKYDVADVLEKTCNELKVDRKTAEQEIAVPLPGSTRIGFRATTPSGLAIEFLIDGHGPCRLGGDQPLSKVVEDELYFFGTKGMHEDMQRSLERIRKFGYHQISVTTRIVQMPPEAMDELDLEWSIAENESLVSAEDWTTIRGQGVTDDAQILGSVVFDDQTTPPPHDGNVAITPTLFSIVDSNKAIKTIEAIQNHTRANIMQSPKVTLFNGQEGTIQDNSQRPFVVSVKRVEGESETAYQPVIQVIKEGTTTNMQPVLSDDLKSVELTCTLQRTKIEKVDTFSFKYPGAEDGKGITVQIPSVTSQKLEIEKQSLPCDSTLFVSGTPLEIDGRKVITMAIIQVQPINAANQSVVEVCHSQPVPIPASGQAPIRAAVTYRSQPTPVAFPNAYQPAAAPIPSPSTPETFPTITISAADDDSMPVDFEPLVAALRKLELDPLITGHVEFVVSDDSVEVKGKELNISMLDFQFVGATGWLRFSDASCQAKFTGNAKVKFGEINAEADSFVLSDEAVFELTSNVVLAMRDTQVIGDRIEIDFDSETIRAKNAKVIRNADGKNPVTMSAVQLEWDMDKYELSSGSSQNPEGSPVP